jgi:hypothetical protein
MKMGERATLPWDQKWFKVYVPDPANYILGSLLAQSQIGLAGKVVFSRGGTKHAFFQLGPKLRVGCAKSRAKLVLVGHGRYIATTHDCTHS